MVDHGVVFSARDLWQHATISPALASTFVEAGIQNARQLGKRLRQMSNTHDGTFVGLERVGIEHGAALWMVP
ncbi:MAG TPA: hypothetical protein VK504_02160 [Vicinamibacterales bacterium]|nr:hypothetical protein [Vicinamibacterales bacterium]